MRKQIQLMSIVCVLMLSITCQDDEKVSKKNKVVLKSINEFRIKAPLDTQSKYNIQNINLKEDF